MPIRHSIMTMAAIVLAADAQFANYQSADLVLGQADFTSSDSGVGSTRLAEPRDVAIDPSTGKVFVADQVNHRVLRYASSASLTNGVAAEKPCLAKVVSVALLLAPRKIECKAHGGFM